MTEYSASLQKNMQIVTAYSVYIYISICIYNKINLIVPVWKEQDKTLSRHVQNTFMEGGPKSNIYVKIIIKLCDISNFYVTKTKKTSKPLVHTILHALHNS